MIPGRRLGYAYQPVDAAGWGPAPFDRICNIRIPYQNAIVNTVAEYYPFWRARLPQQKYRLYGQTTWETDRLPPHWPDLVNLMDGVLVSSDWNRRTFLESGVTIPIRVIPPLSQFNGCPPAGERRRKSPGEHAAASGACRRAGSFSFLQQSANGPSVKGWICSCRPSAVPSLPEKMWP